MMKIGRRIFRNEAAVSLSISAYMSMHINVKRS